MQLSTTLLVAALLSVRPSSTLAVFAPPPVNLERGHADAFSAICANKMSQALGVQTVPPAVASAALDGREELTAAAAQVGAETFVELRLVGLSDRINVLAVWRAADGAEKGRAELIAAGLDDAPPVCERLALALARGTSADQTLSRSNVTREEARVSAAPHRRGAEKVIGLRTSFFRPVATGERIAPMGSLSFDARFEWDSYFFELGAGLLIPAAALASSSTESRYGGLISEIGAGAYLTGSDVAPYVVGGLAPRLIFSGTVINFTPYVAFGLMGPRSASTRVFGEVRVAQNVLSPLSGSSALPTELGASLGIGW